MGINIQSYSDPASPHPSRSQLIRIAEKCTRVAACVTSCDHRAFFISRLRVHKASLHPHASRVEPVRSSCP